MIMVIMKPVLHVILHRIMDMLIGGSAHGTVGGRLGLDGIHDTINLLGRYNRKKKEKTTHTNRQRKIRIEGEKWGIEGGIEGGREMICIGCNR